MIGYKENVNKVGLSFTSVGGKKNKNKPASTNWKVSE